MKKYYAIFICFLIGAINSSQAQNFTKEREKFVKEWQRLVTDEVAQDFCKDILPKMLKSSTITDGQFSKIVDDCNTLKGKEVPIYPELFRYLASALYQVENKFPSVFNNEWNSILMGYQIKDPTKFSEFLDDNNIILDTNIKDDHFALGIIDNFAKRLKLVFAKKFLKYKTKNWIQYLNEIIKSYNNSSHSSLDGLTPNEASEDKNYDQIYRLNYIKGLKNKTISDLKVGDKVRIKIAGKFTKSSEPEFSDQVYEVKTIKGQTINLSNGESKKRYNLLKVPKDAITIQNNIINQVNQKARQKRKLKQEGLI
jgi:hypothetical protein